MANSCSPSLPVVAAVAAARALPPDVLAGGGIRPDVLAGGGMTSSNGSMLDVKSEPIIIDWNFDSYQGLSNIDHHTRGYGTLA